METIIYLCGIHSIGFAIFHMFFWKMLRWNVELQKIGYINRGVMQMLNVALIILAFMVGMICFLFPQDLLNTSLGKFLLASMSFFWLVRFIEQFIFLKINDWKIHLLTFLFLAGAILFVLPLIKK